MSEHKLKIGAIDAVRVIMNPLDFNNPDLILNYEVLKILFKWNCVHVFIREYGNVYWDIKFRKSLIESIKEMLKRKDKKKMKPITDNFDIVNMFEKRLAKFAGSKYAVAVDSCTHAIHLCLEWEKLKDLPKYHITLPSRTYVSVPMQCINAGFKIEFKDIEWQDRYFIEPYHIIDAAGCFYKDMFCDFESYQFCISFGSKKPFALGKGGMIFTDNFRAYKWLKFASFDGRDRHKGVMEDTFESIGWHYQMIPEVAAQGLVKFNMGQYVEGSAHYHYYRNISKLPCFKDYLI